MKLLLLGDVCPTDHSWDAFASANVEQLFGDTATLFERNDFNVINLECAITDSDKGIDKFGPCLKAPYKTAETLKKLGVDLIGLSNNHIFDFGKVGVRDTLQALSDVQLDYTGFGDNEEDSRKNYYVERNGQKICIIAVCEREYSYALPNRMGARVYDEYITIEDVRAAKQHCDRVIVLYHGGKEFCRYPSPRVYELMRALVRNGADLVIGQHSHCIATYENYQGGHILHGQGNFHFTKPFDFDGWFSCLAVEYDTVRNEVNFVPICADEEKIWLAKSEEKETILTEFAQRNEQLQNGQWRNGWHEFCISMKADYLYWLSKAAAKDSTPREDAVFGHYLDCQAHTDVWRELYPTFNQTNELD